MLEEGEGAGVGAVAGEAHGEVDAFLGGCFVNSGVVS